MKNKTFLVLLMAGFSAMLGVGVISPFLPELVRRHGANGFWIAMIFTGYGISRAVIMPFVGNISDKIGRKIFVVSGLFLYSVVSILYTRAETVQGLTIVRMIHGLSAGMILPVIMAYTGDIAEKGKEGVTTGTLNTIFYLGIALGPFLGGMIARKHGFDAVFYIISAIGAFTTFIVLIFLPDIKKNPSDTASLRKDINIRRLLGHTNVKIVLIMAIMTMSLLAVFMSFMPSVSINDHVDTYHIGIIVSVSIFMAGIFQLFFGRLSDRFDWVGKLLQSGLGIALSMIALFVIPLCPDFKALLLAGACIGTGISISVPALYGVSVGIGQKVGMGRWMGIFSTSMSIGFIIAPIMSGIIMDHMGINSVFSVLAIIGFFVLLTCAYFLFHRKCP